MNAASHTTSRRGFTLVEAVMSMLIVSILLAASMRATGASAMVQHKTSQRVTAQYLADAMMNEILPLAYADVENPVFGRESGEAASIRSGWDDVDDYAGLSESPPTARDGTTIGGLSGGVWRRSVRVEWVNPAAPTQAAVAESGAKRVVVTVLHNGAAIAERSAIRTGAP